MEIKLNHYLVLLFLVLRPTFWKYQILYPRYFWVLSTFTTVGFYQMDGSYFYNHCKISLTLYRFIHSVRKRAQLTSVRAQTKANFTSCTLKPLSVALLNISSGSLATRRPWTTLALVLSSVKKSSLPKVGFRCGRIMTASVYLHLGGTTPDRSQK